MPDQFNDIHSGDFPFMFYTGVNRRVNPYSMKDTELYDMVNFWTERTIGAIKVRPPLTTFLNNPDNEPVKALFYIKTADGLKRLVRMSNGGFYIIDPNSDSTWSTVLAPVTSIIQGPTAPNPVLTNNAGVGTIDWDLTHPATVVLNNQTSHYLMMTGFNFNIPTDATILGVLVQVQHKKTGPGTMKDNSVKLIKGGAVGGNNKASATAWAATDAVFAYGAANDLWGNTLTPADINASNFGIAISVVESASQGTEAMLEANGDGTSLGVYITVTYSRPLANIWNRPQSTILAGAMHIVDQTDTESYNSRLIINKSGIEFNFDYELNPYSVDVIIPPQAKTVMQFHRRVYYGSLFDGVQFYRSRLGYSSIDFVTIDGIDGGSPLLSLDTDISSANFLDVDTDYKGNILKLTNINDRLNIYKDEGIYRYNETALTEMFGLSPLEGSISTMEETKEDYFLTNEGFFKTNGESSKPVGEGWYPLIRQMFNNGITTSKICSGATNFLYFCFMGDVTYDGKTVTNACFVYNIYYDQLTLWSFPFQITAFGYYVNNSQNKVIVMGDVNGNTYFLDTENELGVDVTTPIEAEFRTKYFVFDTPKHDNQFEKLDGFTNPGAEMELLADKNFENEYKPAAQLQGVSTTELQDINSLGAFKVLGFKGVWHGKGIRPEFYGVIPKIIDVEDRTVGKKGQ